MLHHMGDTQTSMLCSFRLKILFPERYWRGPRSLEVGVVEGKLLLKLHCYHQTDFCIKVVSIESHFIVSSFWEAKSQDCVHKPQLLKRKESQSALHKKKQDCVHKPQLLKRKESQSALHIAPRRLLTTLAITNLHLLTYPLATHSLSYLCLITCFYACHLHTLLRTHTTPQIPLSPDGAHLSFSPCLLHHFDTPPPIHHICLFPPPSSPYLPLPSV